MRTAARHVILITLVATVLCAGQVISALPAMNQTVAHAAGRVAAKLSENFRRTSRDYRSVQWKSENPSADLAAWPHVTLVVSHRFTLSPFQYRLPPPAL